MLLASRWVQICVVIIGGVFFAFMGGFAEDRGVEVFSEKNESQTLPIVIDFPESTVSVAQLASVDVVGSYEMTYCSLIAKMNLQRFTGLPATTTFGDPQMILQGDAIRLIEGGLAKNTFLPLEDFMVDMDTYFPERTSYTLFDLYMYTPHSEDEVSEHEYLFQGHRAVILSVDHTWWVMDPLRGNTTSWQSRDVYKQYLDPTAYLFVYNQQYAFATGYELDFSVDMIIKSNRDVQDIPSLVYKGIIVPELDTAFMPMSSTFLSDITFLKDYIAIFFAAGTSIKSSDGSPFNVGLLETQLYRNEKKEILMKIALSGKKLLFSTPVKVTLSLDEAFPKESGTRYVVKMAGAGHDGCEDVFDEKGAFIVDGRDNLLTFSICRTGDYSITPLEEDELRE